MIDDQCSPIIDHLLTARRKSTEWSALEKPVAPLSSSPPAGNTFPGAGEGI
jgi:hypothetical protein